MIACLFLAVSAFFSTNGSMEANGWTLGRAQALDSFSVQDGIVTCVCAPNPYKGMRWQREVDLPPVGELSFEVKTFLAGNGSSNRYFLPVTLGSFMIAFSGQSAVRHFPYPNANWIVVGKNRVPHREWTKVRVRWNMQERTIKYYVGADQVVPSAVEEDNVMNCDGATGPVRLSIGNYGLSSSVETHQLRNLEIRALDAEAAAGAAERDLAVVFRGLGAEFFPIEKWTAAFPKEKIVSFSLEYNGSNMHYANKTSLSGYPDSDICRRASRILLVDMPLTANVLSYKVQENLLAAVRDGATMVVTGGLAGLQRCGDFDAPIAKALPCEFESVFKSPAGGERIVRDYGKGQIVVLNRRKVKEPCIEQ